MSVSCCCRVGVLFSKFIDLTGIFNISVICTVPPLYHVQAEATVSQPDALKEVLETGSKPQI